MGRLAPGPCESDGRGTGPLACVSPGTGYFCDTRGPPPSLRQRLSVAGRVALAESPQGLFAELRVQLVVFDQPRVSFSTSDGPRL